MPSVARNVARNVMAVLQLQHPAEEFSQVQMPVQTPVLIMAVSVVPPTQVATPLRYILPSHLLRDLVFSCLFCDLCSSLSFSLLIGFFLLLILEQEEMGKLVNDLMAPDSAYRFDYSAVQNRGPGHVRKLIKAYVERFFQRAKKLGRSPEERVRALGKEELKRALLHALGGWAGLVATDNLPSARSAERMKVDLTRGFFKLLTVELMPWVLSPSRWSIQYFDVDSMCTHAMLHGMQSVSVWQSLCLVLLPDSYVFMYIVYQGFGHNTGAPVKVGDSASDPLVRHAHFCWLCCCFQLTSSSSDSPIRAA